MTLGKCMLTSMFAYNIATNGRLLDLTASLTDAQIDSSLNDSHGGIRNTFAHLLGIEWRWRMIVETLDPPVVPPPIPHPATIEALRVFAAGESAAISAWLGARNEEELTTAVAIEYRGEMTMFTPWHALVQLLSHSMQHRSELAQMLTQLGKSPGDIDFIYWIDPD